MDDPLRPLLEATTSSVLTGPGATSPEQRQALARGEAPAELQALVQKIRGTPWEVTDEDWAALGSYTDEQKYELVVATSLGAARERFLAALQALEGA